MREERPIAVLGAGGHAKVVISTLRAAGETVGAIFDDDLSKVGGEICGTPVEGSIAKAAGLGFSRAVIAVGDNTLRRRIAERLELDWVTVVHPAASVDPAARLGAGSVVFAGAVIQADAVIGEHVIVNTSASVDHDCAIGSFVHLAPGSVLGGGVEVGEGALVGLGASIKPYTRIGSDAVIGCGAAVVSDIGTKVTAVGVPARPVID